jgi:hypothetical protein
MTEEEAFKQLAVEALGGFGWTISVDDIPSYEDTMTVIRRLGTWWNGIDQFTRDLIRDFDLADGLWNAGWMYEWPGLYSLMAGNPFGRFNDTINDISESLQNAHGRAPDYSAQHAVGRMEDDPAFQTGQEDPADTGN